jgi:hypothetical protein
MPLVKPEKRQRNQEANQSDESEDDELVSGSSQKRIRSSNRLLGSEEDEEVDIKPNGHAVNGSIQSSSRAQTSSHSQSNGTQANAHHG